MAEDNQISLGSNGWAVCRCDAGDDPRPDVDWTGDLHDEADHGPAIACSDDTGEPLFLVWWDYFGNGVSRITHWRPLPAEFAAPASSIIRTQEA